MMVGDHKLISSKGLPRSLWLCAGVALRHHVTMLGLTDAQLEIIMTAANAVPVARRSVFLERVGAMLKMRGRFTDGHRGVSPLALVPFIAVAAKLRTIAELACAKNRSLLASLSSAPVPTALPWLWLWLWHLWRSSLDDFTGCATCRMYALPWLFSTIFVPQNCSRNVCAIAWCTERKRSCSVWFFSRSRECLSFPLHEEHPLRLAARAF